MCLNWDRFFIGVMSSLGIFFNKNHIIVSNQKRVKVLYIHLKLLHFAFCLLSPILWRICIQEFIFRRFLPTRDSLVAFPTLQTPNNPTKIQVNITSKRGICCYWIRCGVILPIYCKRNYIYIHIY